MAKYRDEVEAARLRAETLEAELKERGAELKERDAALAARDAKIRELEARLERDPDQAAAPPPAANSGSRMALIAGLVVLVGVAVAVSTTQQEASVSVPPPVDLPIPEPPAVPIPPPVPTPPAPEPAAPPAPDTPSNCGCAPEDLMCQMRCVGSGTVNINSIPPASVIVDGKPHGQTPVVGLSLKPGSHIIVLKHPEHGTKSRTITVKANKTSTVAVRF